MSLGKIAIVGTGAIGAYYGARLQQAGEDVTFLARSDYAHLKSHGLEVNSVAGDFTLPSLNCAEDSRNIGIVDLVIVAWKSTSNHLAEKVITPLIGEHTTILTLQNGLGNCEHLADLFGAHRILGGLCFVCINRTAPGVISHTASGLVRIGAFLASSSKKAERIVKAFNHAQFPCEYVYPLEKALWMKLVWNIPFNGLAIAEGGVDTEVLLKDRKQEPLVRALMAEVLTIASALGHHIPASFIDTQLKITYPMGPYRPSSMIDYVEGRPVEFDSIWQKPLDTAQRLQIAVPEMARLTQRIASLLPPS